MTADEILQIEGELRDENPFRFAEVVLPPSVADLIRSGLAKQMNYVESPYYAQARGGEFAERLLAAYRLHVLNRLQILQSTVSESVCEQYCDLKRSGRIDSEALKIAISVADALVSAKVAFPAPIFRTAVYIVRNSVLDNWCDCAERPALPEPES